MPPTSSRPEAMNVTTNHPKVKVNARLSDAFFIAGSAISGKMDLECKADKGLALGMVQVELYAIEELTSRDHSARSNFMHAVRLFQGQGLPPSNAVLPHPLPGEPPLPPNYWQARRGQTSFLFKFDLPSHTPGTMDFGRGLARVRYEVRATAAVAWKGERRLVTNVKEAVVVEDIEDAELKAEAIVVGESGKIWIQGRVIGGVLVAGHSACLELQVKNHSTKKNTGLVVTLGRHLHLPNVAPGDKQPLQISDTLTSVDFKGAEYIVGPGVEGIANLVFDVPKHAAGVRGGQREGEDGEGRISSPLFEVRCMVSCRMTMGIGSKDIQLEIPVRIVHEVVLPPPPVPEEYAPEEYPVPLDAVPRVHTGQPMPAYAQDPRATSPYPYDPRPVSPYAYAPNGPMVPPHPSLSPRPTSPYMSPRPSSPYMYQQPPMPVMPPMQPFVDSSRVWIPPPIAPYQYYTPPMPGLAHSPPSMNQIPIRSPSTQPPMATYLQHVPTGLPANAAGQQPLLAALAAVSDRPEDEGKGERAARISHHLRATSRHRSVSPPANRSMDDEPVLPTSPGLIATSPPDGGALSLSPNSHDRPRRMSLDDRASGSPIHSPRPLLSPKASFTREAVAQGGSVKSTNVVALEELAGAADKLHADMSSDLPMSALVDAAALVALDHNKTLPGPPVPSGKVSANLAPRPRAEDVFVVEPPTPASVTRAPPTPTLVAFSPGRHQRASPAAIDSLAAPGGESGLDALERRLLAQVGTRKVEKESRPDVRSVLSVDTEPPAVSTPIAIPPRKSSGQDTPMGDSAISSLTLSNGRSVDERPQLLSTNPMVDLGVGMTLGQRLSLENVKSAEASPRRTPSPPGTPRSPIEEEPRGSKEMRKSGSARGSGGPTKEVVQLRKAAKGRIAAWLETVTPDVPPQVDSIASSPEPTPPPATAAFDLKEEDLDSSDDGKTNKARSRVPSPVPALPKVASKVNGDLSKPTSKHGQPTTAVAEVNVAPNPRSSGFVPIGSIKPKFTSGTPTITKSPRLPVFPPTSGLAAPEVKYDVRSARGGRGGKVTAVAALWANQKQDDKKSSGVNMAPIFKPAVTRSPSAPSMKQQAAAKPPAPTPPTRTKDAVKLSASTPTSDATVSPPKWSDVAKKPPVPRLARPTPFADVAKVRPSPPVSSPTAARPNMGDLTANRARMIKSPTVPAMISSSHATPTISSTASLVRPTSPPATPVALPGLAKNRLPTPLSPRKEAPPTVSTGPPKMSAPVVSNRLRDELRSIATSPPPVKAASPEPAGGGVGQTRLRELIKKYQGQAK